MKPFFVSTAIPYVNAEPHVGHALEYVQADAYVRARKLIGDEVFFLTGTDDNALKNVQAAEKAGRPIKEYIAENAEHFIELDRKLDVAYDDFIRTSVDPRHRAGVEKLWKATSPDDLYKKSYKGYYCVGCEEFKTEKDLINGECPEHPGRPLEIVEEENYFFRLSAYQDRLEKLIESNEFHIIPESRRNETLAFIKGGLEDFSVSRSAARAKGWGIPVPGDPDQYLYVWYDALANYITALGYANDSELYQKFWTAEGAQKVHMIGKGINRFHTIYWPAMLLSAGVPLPSTVFVHGYIISGGQKMSKTLGNVVSPGDLIERYGSEAVRYFLLRHGSPTEDFDLTDEKCHEWYTAHLVNGLGNLVARVMRLAEEHLPHPVELTEEDAAVEPAFLERMGAFKFNEAMDLVFEHIGKGDAYMTEKAPYQGIKSGDAVEREEARKDIEKLVKHLAKIGAHLAPAMPRTSAAIASSVRHNKRPDNLFPRLP